MDSRNNEGNLVSPEDAFRIPINKAQLKACFPSMSWAAWERGQYNIPKHCTDEWMRLNWEIYRARVRCTYKRRTNTDRVGLKFMTLLWHTRNGMNIDWESFNISARTPLHAAKRRRHDVELSEDETTAAISNEGHHAGDVQGCSNWHTKNGMDIDGKSFNMSYCVRPLRDSAKRSRNDWNENLNENELEATQAVSNKFPTSVSAEGRCSDGEQPVEPCTDCLNFYQERRGLYSRSSNLKVEVPGCSKCHARHVKEINLLETKLKALKLDFDREKILYETKLEVLEEKSRQDVINLKAQYERVSAKLPRDFNNLSKADNNGNLIEFLKVRRDCNRGDVIITVSDSQIFADGIILATRSPVFEKLLQSDTSETHTKDTARTNLRIDGLSSPVVEAIIDFCYTGEIDFSESVPPPEVLKGAHTFQLALLNELTEAELCRGLVVDNVPQMLKLSRRYSAPRLQEEAGKLFKDNFDILSGRVFEVMEGPSHSSVSARTSERRDSESKLHDNPSETGTVKGEKSVQRAELPSAVKENNLDSEFGNGKESSKLPRNLDPNGTRSAKVPFGPRSVNIDEDQIPQQPAHRPTKSSVRIPSSKPASEGDTKSRKIEVADADFHDFDKYRTEKDFLPGQIWAIYDDQDGMPRFYGRISRVSTKPFRAHMNWVNHCPMSPKEVAWTDSNGFSIACGLFNVAYKTTIMNHINSFSHIVTGFKLENGMLEIYPKAGQVWAVHWDWDADRSIRSASVARSKGLRQHTFDMVEILSEFSEENGINAALLSKISEFKTVFIRQGIQAVRRFKPTELVKFSHSVPNQKIDDLEADSYGIPRGALELDPAAVDALPLGN